MDSFVGYGPGLCHPTDGRTALLSMGLVYVNLQMDSFVGYGPGLCHPTDGQLCWAWVWFMSTDGQLCWAWAWFMSSYRWTALLGMGLVYVILQMDSFVGHGPGLCHPTDGTALLGMGLVYVILQMDSFVGYGPGLCQRTDGQLCWVWAWFMSSYRWDSFVEHGPGLCHPTDGTALLGMGLVYVILQMGQLCFTSISSAI